MAWSPQHAHGEAHLPASKPSAIQRKRWLGAAGNPAHQVGGHMSAGHVSLARRARAFEASILAEGIEGLCGAQGFSLSC